MFDLSTWISVTIYAKILKKLSFQVVRLDNLPCFHHRWSELCCDACAPLGEGSLASRAPPALLLPLLVVAKRQVQHFFKILMRNTQSLTNKTTSGTIFLHKPKLYCIHSDFSIYFYFVKTMIIADLLWHCLLDPITQISVGRAGFIWLFPDCFYHRGQVDKGSLVD